MSERAFCSLGLWPLARVLWFPLLVWDDGDVETRRPAGKTSFWFSLQACGRYRLWSTGISDQHSSGTQVRVVGVTCAACLFPCMSDLRFPVVVLDECSQVTEPASLLPIAR